MISRRSFLISAAAAVGVAVAQPVLGKAAGRDPLTRKERVDRALAGQDVDRPPFTHWHHFGPQTPEEHAKATLDYHWKYKTDIVKVMSDYPYPKPDGNWYELKVLDNPFPDQIRALELIRDGLHGDAYILETAFNPWQVAVKLSSKEEVVRLQQENPQRLLDALDVLTQSHINHAKRAFATGASGILFSIANANRAELSAADYAKFSAPFDKRFFAATASAKLNFLHLHWENEYVDQFLDFQAPSSTGRYSPAACRSARCAASSRRRLPPESMRRITKISPGANPQPMADRQECGWQQIHSYAGMLSSQ